MVEIGVLGVFAGIAVAMSFFLAYFLIVQVSKKNSAVVWLGLAVLAIGLRIAKSIIFFIFYEISPIGLAIGFFALASIGPLFLTYVSKSHHRDKKISSSILLHFLIPVVGAITCFVITPDPLETTLYESATLLLSVYLGVVLYRHLRFQYDTSVEKRWISTTLVVGWGAWSAFVLQHLAGTIVFYAYGSLVASAFIFYLFMKVLQNPPVFGVKTKKVAVSNEVLAEVRRSFELDRVFLQTGISVNSLSEQIQVPAYQVTKAVRELYNKSFPEALSHFRVIAFKELISDPEQSNFTIEYLAEQSGFKTTSSFYTAFKKETGMTPTEYMESSQLKTA
ncbi:MAG: hypothetical protein CMB80_20150 [Flammeovirgaceae bacterium]|nr:hypothetical protein [Flammeovirgaceae bacterium]MBE61047.1 hypothetical protein [Flammeovirgaceae bacterium]HCX21092.1 hypothetical protein [Cytophagales bacterium]|tara:strand:+ start:4625 stop:5629 length:1005 start_codon:yes stop_codon:yes gene_type:complete